MRHESAESVASSRAIAIAGQQCPRRDKIVPRKFGAVAKLLWRKPAAHIANIIKKDERTAKRILRGEADVPVELALAALDEMLRPQN